MTDDEREDFRTLFDQLHTARDAIRVRLGMIPAPIVTPAPDIHVVPEPVEPQTVDDDRELEEDEGPITAPEPVSTYELPRELYDEVGLFKLNGIVTHALGDDHAAKILDGRVAVEEARATHEDARRRAYQMSASPLIWNG